MVGSQPQKSKGFKKIGFLDYPLDIHITATEDQLKNDRVTIIVNRKINKELYETVIPNVRVDEFPIQFIEDEENEALDFITQQEKMPLIVSEKIEETEPQKTKTAVNLCLF